MKKAFIFDAYGTLLDVHSAVRRHAAAIGPDADAFSELWRVKQLEYAWVRTLIGTYQDFWQLTEQALTFAFTRFPGVDTKLREELLGAYMRLEPNEGALETLKALKAAGAKTAVLSNGPPLMLETACDAAKLRPLLDELFSVDERRVFKTHPDAYAIYQRAWSLDPHEIAFVSSNRWDIAGATRFGFHTIWFKRTGVSDEYEDLPPFHRISALPELL